MTEDKTWRRKRQEIMMSGLNKCTEEQKHELINTQLNNGSVFIVFIVFFYLLWWRGPLIDLWALDESQGMYRLLFSAARRDKDWVMLAGQVFAKQLRTLVKLKIKKQKQTKTKKENF